MRHPRPARSFSDFNLSEKLASNGILAAKISGIANGQFEDKLNNQVIDVDTGEVVSGSVLNSRVERYKLKSAVNDFISKSRTAKCMRWIRGNNQAQVFTYINPQSQRHMRSMETLWFAGMFGCVRYVLRKFLSDDVRNDRCFRVAKKQGFDVAMLTLTAPHYIGDELKQLVDRLQDALAKGFRDRSGKKFHQKVWDCRPHQSIGSNLV